MKNLEIKGLLFVQTHDSDPVRYDVRDADFKRVAYVEFDGCQLVCSTSGPDAKVLYKTNVTDRYLEVCIGHVADVINSHLNGCKSEPKNTVVKIWHISGYKGYNDHDGTEDDNMNFDVAMDARFNQQEIEDIFLSRYSKKYRVVVVKATAVKEVEIQ